MPRETFQRNLDELQDKLLTLGSMVESALLHSVKALKKQDVKAARQLIAQDRLVNETA